MNLHVISFLSTGLKSSPVARIRPRCNIIHSPTAVLDGCSQEVKEVHTTGTSSQHDPCSSAFERACGVDLAGPCEKRRRKVSLTASHLRM